MIHSPLNFSKGPLSTGSTPLVDFFFEATETTCDGPTRQAEELGLSLNEATYEILAHMALRCKKSYRRFGWRGPFLSVEFDKVV